MRHNVAEAVDKACVGCSQTACHAFFKHQRNSILQATSAMLLPLPLPLQLAHHVCSKKEPLCTPTSPGAGEAAVARQLFQTAHASALNALKHGKGVAQS
jgi:hypothetical protein